MRALLGNVCRRRVGRIRLLGLVTTLPLLLLKAGNATTPVDIFHRAEEKRLETTSFCTSGTWSTHSDRHVVKVHVKRWASDTSDSSYEYITTSDVFIPQQCEGSPVDSGHSMEYVDGGADESGYTFNQALHFTNPPTANSHDYVAVDMPIDNSFVYGYVAVRYRIRAIVKDVNTHAVITDFTTDTLYKLKVRKIDATKDASVDERVGFPDDGNSTDPNSGATHLNFGSSIYKGGLFAGKFSANSDHSGESRIQIGCYQPTGSFLFAMVSMMYLGSPANATGTLVLGVFIPTSPGGWSESGVTWDYKFDIQPRSSLPSGQSWDMSRDPIDTISFPMTGTTFPLYDYASWTLLRYDTSGYPTPSAYSNICIAPLDPASPKWCYFADKEYSDIYDGISGAETSKKVCGPRIWVISVELP